jgi:hypothetical protein
LKEISEIDVLIPEELVKEQVLLTVGIRNPLLGCMLETIDGLHDQYADILGTDPNIDVVFHRDGLEG